MAGRFLGSLVIIVGVASAGCASVLGVDQNYVLGDEGNDGGVTESAAPPTTGIHCGNQSCDPANQLCCLASDNSLSCSHGNGCRGTSIHCDVGAGCSGQVCCINIDMVNVLQGTSCQASCPSATAGSRSLQLCNPDASTCTSGSCSVVSPLAPSPPFAAGWFYACQ
jgi:hypothetical protein